MYKIVLGSSKAKEEGELKVLVDTQRDLVVPPSIALGVGNKAPRLKDYYEKCLSDEKFQRTLKFFAFIHKEAKKGTQLRLVCQCRFKNFHAHEVKGFLETHGEILDIMLPYLFPEQGYTPPSTDTSTLPQEVQKLVSQLPAVAPEEAVEKTDRPQLSDTDMAQIRALIEADQAKEALNSTEGSSNA